VKFSFISLGKFPEGDEFLKTALLRCNLHTIQFAYLKCLIGGDTHSFGTPPTLGAQFSYFTLFYRNKFSHLKRKCLIWGWECSSVVEYLPSIHKTLSLVSRMESKVFIQWFLVYSWIYTIIIIANFKTFLPLHKRTHAL
jgi:hypothetical protein